MSEKDYETQTPLDFSMALKALKDGKSVFRKGWNPHIWIELQVPDENSKMTKPYIYMVKNSDKFPCDLSCESIMGEDWEIKK